MRAETFTRAVRTLVYLAVASSPTLVLAQDVAYVLEVQGRWHVRQRPAEDLRKGSALQPKDTITPRQGFEPLDSIVVMGLGEQTLARRECKTRRDCGPPIQISDPSTAADPLVTRIVRAVMSQWERDARKFTVYSGRGAADLLAEGVVRISDGRADLARILALSAGTYTLTWQPVQESASEARPRAVPITGPPGETTVPLDLPPGLYEVLVFEEGSSPEDGALSEAWVLIAEPDSYPRLSQDFDAAVAATRPWAPKVHKETLRSFLRAYLFELASSSRAGQG